MKNSKLSFRTFILNGAEVCYGIQNHTLIGSCLRRNEKYFVIIMVDFKLDFLDHVAINVKDINASVTWYEKVLGLKRYQLEKWGEHPIFMLSGKTGVALFPANTNDPKLEPTSNTIKIDHFAFQISQNAFAKAKQHYEDLELTFTVKNHHYFHSIYTKDLDGHVVELTTLVVDEGAFYQNKNNT